MISGGLNAANRQRRRIIQSKRKKRGFTVIIILCNYILVFTILIDLVDLYAKYSFISIYHRFMSCDL